VAENRYFVLSAKEPELSGDELNLYFEYRALTEQEKKETGSQNKQEKLDEKAAKALEEKLKGNKITLQLWETKEDQSLLLQHLHRYTRKNKYDFFIHKNLKGFLQRELDYYIKSELVNVDDLYVLETDLHFDRIRHNFRTIKVFKNIADTIIDLLSHIEEFQKMLWEKKKFVLNTEWVITIDRLVEWLGEEGAKPFMVEALKNEKQCNEWKELFGEKHAPAFKPAKASVENLKYDLYSWIKFPIDTIHFEPEFKVRLINALSTVIDLEEKLDGLVIHSDNYHGLLQLHQKFHSSIQSVYIDPPYNTDASQIIYKNGYKISSWTTLINDRMIATKSLLKAEGILCATIDDFQQRELYSLLIENFSKSAMLATVVIRNNPSGRPVPSGFGISHEYGFFVAKSPNVVVGKFERTVAQNKRYKEKDRDSTFMWELLRKRGSDSERKDSPKAFFPIYFKKGKLRVPQMEWNDGTKIWINIEKPSLDEIVLWPIDENNIERRWRWGLDTIKSNLDQLKVEFDKNNIGTVYYKYRPPQHSIPLTNWIDAKYSSTEHGTGILKNLFKQYNPFSYPKSLYAVADSLTISSGNLKDYLCLDYFAGSGTTFHATQYLNRNDEGTRKCILIEQGEYVYTIIIPRIKKIAYTFDWEDGQPKDKSMNGLGVFFKYQRLEQYEESLENIAFSASEKAVQKALEFKDYIPKYFLEFETRNSRTLVNTEAMADPWDYQLKVWDGFTYDTLQAVDLVETFNYLIGLHMHKCITKEIDGRRYQFIHGKNNGNKQILIVWRNVRDWDLAAFEADGKVLREELIKWTYDVLYINGQAHIEGYQPIEEVFKNKMNS
jgi:adenine-specific DNA-methyltransferase